MSLRTTTDLVGSLECTLFALTRFGIINTLFLRPSFPICVHTMPGRGFAMQMTNGACFATLIFVCLSARTHLDSGVSSHKFSRAS